MDQPQLRILGVNAHPHDFTHYSGTLGIHNALGDEVTVVSVTAGTNTHNEALRDELLKPPEDRDPKIMNQSEEEYAELKAEEMRKACGFFGITDVRVLNFPEPFYRHKYPEAIDALRDIIYEVRPHVMITQSAYLIGPRGQTTAAHDDHAEVAYASLEARAAASVATFGSTQAPHTIAEVYFPGVYFQRDEYDFIVDISDYFEQRVQAEASYVSQGHTPEGSRHRISRGTGATGGIAGVEYAEAFVREKAEVVPRIIVTESSLRRAGESHHDAYQRRGGKKS